MNQSNAFTIQENKTLDVFKFIATILIVVSHCLPLFPGTQFDFFFGQWFFRFCVPLFFISSGYFFASFSHQRRVFYTKRIGILYLLGTILYFPAFYTDGLRVLLSNLLLGYYHLWYLSALLLGLCALLIIHRFAFFRNLFDRIYPAVAIILLLLGALMDEYFALFPIRILSTVHTALNLIGGARHAMFFALPLLMIGIFLQRNQNRISLSAKSCVLLAVGFFGLSLLECLMLRSILGEHITCDITVFNCYPAVFLFLLSQRLAPTWLAERSTKKLRKLCDVVYLLHLLLVLFAEHQEMRDGWKVMFVLSSSMLLSWIVMCVSEWIKRKVRGEVHGCVQ